MKLIKIFLLWLVIINAMVMTICHFLVTPEGRTMPEYEVYWYAMLILGNLIMLPLATHFYYMMNRD